MSILTKKRAGKMVQAVLQSLLKKPATGNYPFDHSRMPEGFRGRLVFYPEKCTGCKLCMRDCPSNAIVINRITKTEIEAEIDLAKCIYCGQCVDSCPRGALEVTGEFELAQIERGKLHMTFKIAPEDKADDEPDPDAAN